MAQTDPSSDRPSSATNPLDLRVRAAWLYYIEGLTQEQVAARLGISRIKVLRLLASAREEGLVQIRINAKAGHQIALERKLEARFGLSEAIVVPSGPDDIVTAHLIGHAAGVHLSEQIRDGMTVGIGWGATLQASLKSLAWRDVSDVTVISLLGGLTHATALNPSAVAWLLADYFKAECYQITAPAYVPDEGLATALWGQPDLKELRRRAGTIDIALVSVGDVSEVATIFRQNMLPWSEGKGLKAAGAVGDLLGHFIDAAGQIVDHPVNRRVMAISPAEIGRVPKVVIASGGIRKVQAIRAGIAACRAATLITDEATAETLLESPA